MGNLNIFGKKKEDDFSKQLSAQEYNVNKEIAASTSPEEQYMLDNKEQSDNITKWQQDLTNALIKMRHELKGEIEIDGEWEKKQKQLCTDESIYKIVQLAQSVANQYTMMTKYSEDIISRHQISIENNFIIDIALPERIKYKTSQSNLSTVKQIFRSYTKPALYRSLLGGERTHMSTIRTVKELQTDGMQQNKPKKNMFGW